MIPDRALAFLCYLIPVIKEQEISQYGEIPCRADPAGLNVLENDDRPEGDRRRDAEDESAIYLVTRGKCDGLVWHEDII